MKPIEFVYTLLCDDARKEDNGKELLIGVYSGGILVPSMPAFLALVMWCQVRVAETGDYNLRFRVLDDSGAELVVMPPARLHIQKKTDIEGDDLSSLSIGQVPLEIRKPGRLHFEVKVGEADWERIKSTALQVR